MLWAIIWEPAVILTLWVFAVSVVPQTNFIVSGDRPKTREETSPRASDSLENLLSKWVPQTVLLCMVYFDIYRRQFLDLLHRLCITPLGVICVVFSLQYCWARKTEDDPAEGSHPGRGSGGSGKRLWNEWLGVQQQPAFVPEYQQRNTHHSQLRG